jgi:hypothetical protein
MREMQGKRLEEGCARGTAPVFSLVFMLAWKAAEVPSRETVGCHDQGNNSLDLSKSLRSWWEANGQPRELRDGTHSFVSKATDVKAHPSLTQLLSKRQCYPSRQSHLQASDGMVQRQKTWVAS